MGPVTGQNRALGLGLALVAVLAGGVAVLAGGAPRAGAVTVPRIDLRTEKYRLANGLEVILRRETRLPVAAVNLWYHVGAANEEAGRTGFAHLFEHMMFEGSGHVPEGQADKLLEGIGASENASTNFDYTNYIVPDVPANQLELALWLQSDRMGFLLDRLDQTSLSNQQAVVRNERRERYDDAPYGLADEELYHRLFPTGHPYHADIIGSHADIASAGLDTVRDFFRHYYVPNNASLVIVGDIDVARTKQLVEKYFGTIPRGPDVPRRVVPAPPLTREQRVSLTDTVELPRVAMAWLTPPVFQPGDYDAAVTKQLLVGTRASRLTRRLVHDLRIAQSVDVDLESLTDGSVFTVTATAKPGHTVAELETAIDSELDVLARRPPTPAEVAAAETAIIARSVAGLDDLGNFGGLADQLNFYNHYLGDPDRLADDLHRTAAVTPQRVRRFAAEQLDRNRRVVVEVVPGAKPTVDDPPAPPEEPAAADGAGDNGATPPSAEPWRNSVPGAGPAPATPVPPVERFTLGNGLPVWLVESHRLPMVSASLVSQRGSAADPPDRPGLAALATSALDGGTTHRDALGLSRELEAAGATLGNDTGKDGTWLAATGLAGHAADTLGILADVARNPTFPADEVDRVRDAGIVALRQSRDSADTIAETVGAGQVYGAGHPYAHPATGTEDGLRVATVDDLRRAHDRAFTPADTALVLAGDVTPAQARTLAEAAFGSWPPAGRPESDGAPAGGASAGPAVPPAGTTPGILLVDKPGASQTALYVAAPGLARSDPDYETLLVTNDVFGGSFSSRLNQNLRETHGYTYGAYSDVDALRDGGLLTITMDVQGPSTADAVKETFHELETVTATGVTPDELARAKQSLTGSIPGLFGTRSKVLSTLRTLYLYDLPADYYRTRPGRLAGITSDTAAAVARRRFRPGAFTVVAVGDRAAIEAPLRALHLGPVSLGSP
ncbi:MAG: zinc protease [Actinomycetota bacterium]|nr:zinc protease [Actinomycetota bacterium]